MNNLLSLKDKIKSNNLKEIILDEESNRVVRVNLWSGGDLINYEKFVKKITKDSTFEDTIEGAIKTLVYDKMDEESKSKYYTQEELMYILTRIHQLTFPVLETTIMCSNDDCSNVYEVKIEDYNRETNLHKNGVIELSNTLAFNIGNFKK